MQSGIPNDECILLFPQIPSIFLLPLEDMEWYFPCNAPENDFLMEQSHTNDDDGRECEKVKKLCFIVRNWYINWSKTGSKNTNKNAMEKKWISWSGSWNGSFVCVEQSERLTERARECNKSRREMHILLFEHRKNKQSQLFEVEKLRLE